MDAQKAKDEGKPAKKKKKPEIDSYAECYPG